MYHSLFTLAVLGAVAALVGEIIGSFQRNLLVRKALYGSVLLFLSVGTLLLLVSRPDVGALVISVFSCFRAVNAVRVLKGRMQEERAYEVTRRTSLVLILTQFVVLCGWILLGTFSSNLHLLLWLYVPAMLAVSICIAWSTKRTLKHARLQTDEKNLALDECPTVSVCIPARNETEDMASCLRSVLNTTYPKIEVLVLDDCSQDKTSEVIKKFAHDGARFIQGEPPKQGWLAKNQAYETLAEAATGEYLLFCGVDVRLEPETIGRLMKLMVSRKKQMVSVMPRRADYKESPGYVQIARYWWELALPRRLFSRPPVLSTTWLIESKTLRKLGGFKAVGNTIVPESFFAKELVKQDGYSFVTATESLKVLTVKNHVEQRATAIRVRYPQLRKRPESVVLLMLAEIGLLLVPCILLFVLPFMGMFWLWVMTIATITVYEYTNFIIVYTWSPKPGWIPSFSVIVIADLCFTLISMWQYEFATVTWKDRNICIPVMHVIPRLPPLKD